MKVQGPRFAEDPMNVPIVVATELPGVQQLIALVDRNPIRKALELQPLATQPAVSFRFKMEQASPALAPALMPALMPALTLTADGVWHVGGALENSSCRGCTVADALHHLTDALDSIAACWPTSPTRRSSPNMAMPTRPVRP